MLIQDRENPTGMFSKAGRFSIEMFALLQEKDNIMTNKKKVYYPKAMQLETEATKKTQTESSHHKLQGFGPPGKLDPQAENKKKKFAQLEQKEKQPFTKTVSRQQLDDISDKIRINNQKFGMYNPKYHFIYEKSPFYQDQDFLDEQRQSYLNRRNSISPKDRSSGKSPKIKKSDNRSSKLLKNTSMSTLQRQEVHPSSSILSIQQSISDSNILSPKIKGCIEFSRMQPRPQFANTLGSPHEKRFEFIEFPDIYTKVKKPLNIYFQKAKKDSNMFNLQQSGLQYDINYNAIYPKTDKMISNFEKITARKFPMKPIYTMDESQADISLYKTTEVKTPTVNESQLLKRIPGITFKTMLPRDHVSNSSRMLPTEGI